VLDGRSPVASSTRVSTSLAKDQQLGQRRRPLPTMRSRTASTVVHARAEARGDWTTLNSYSCGIITDVAKGNALLTSGRRFHVNHLTGRAAVEDEHRLRAWRGSLSGRPAS
jgi:hypothetical protein